MIDKEGEEQQSEAGSTAPKCEKGCVTQSNEFQNSTGMVRQDDELSSGAFSQRAIEIVRDLSIKKDRHSNCPIERRQEVDEEEQDEIAMVIASDAVIDPYAMMIVPSNTPTRNFTVAEQPRRRHLLQMLQCLDRAGFVM